MDAVMQVLPTMLSKLHREHAARHADCDCTLLLERLRRTIDSRGVGLLL